MLKTDISIYFYSSDKYIVAHTKSTYKMWGTHDNAELNNMHSCQIMCSVLV
jgi:hypothetical protein